MSRKKKQKWWQGKPKNFYQTDEWRKVRAEVIRTYGPACMKCHRVTSNPHVDHVRPRSRFPRLELSFENLQVLCKTCNEEKGTGIADYRKEILTPTTPPQNKRPDWQFFDKEKVDYNNGRSLSKEEIERLGYTTSAL